MIVTVLAWLLAQPANLADLARREALRRQATLPAVRSLTNQDVANLPPRVAPTPPDSPAEVAAAPSEPAAPPGDAPVPKTTETHDEAWWGTRLAAARGVVEHDQLLADALQSRINALTTDASARDDPAQRAQLYDQRNQAIAELEKMKTQIEADKSAVDDVQEDARKQGVPPGWVR